MSNVLIVYGTTEGQTAKISEVIAGVITEKGHQAKPIDIKDLGDDSPANYEAVVVGASIHVGKHDKHVVDFVEKHRDALTQLPSAFYSVSLAAHGDSSEAEGYVDEFEKATGWQPGWSPFSAEPCSTRSTGSSSDT